MTLFAQMYIKAEKFFFSTMMPLVHVLGDACVMSGQKKLAG